MKRLIANLMVLGFLGVSTAATAQTLEQRRLENERARIQQNERVRDRNAQVLGERREDIMQNERVRERNAQVLGQRRDQIIANQRWGQYNRNVWAQRRFQAGFYRPPPGFYYRRWSYGQILPSIYFAQDYWINNWFAFGLFAPPPGLVWVRYGPDVLLVDRYTGQIVQVRYGIFY